MLKYLVCLEQAADMQEKCSFQQQMLLLSIQTFPISLLKGRICKFPHELLHQESDKLKNRSFAKPLNFSIVFLSYLIASCLF